MSSAEEAGRTALWAARGTARRDGATAGASPAIDGAARTENFPVASLMLRPAVRCKVVAFYNYARAADDAADDPRLSPGERTDALRALELGLDGGRGDPRGRTLREAVGEGPELAFARDLMRAFHRDAVGIRCRDWADLMSYCEASAAPVGRFMLAVHGEAGAARAPADALCAALQVLNHVQDIAADRRDLGRRYLPGDWMDETGAREEDLTAAALTPALRRVLDRTLYECDALLEAAAPLPARIASRGLRAQAATTSALARRLAARLRVEDPLAGRVRPSRPDFFHAGLAGLWAAR